MLDFIKVILEIFTMISLWLYAVNIIVDVYEKNHYYNIFNLSLLFMILSATVYNIMRVGIIWFN